MKQILLHGAHGEKFATVDDDDFALVEQFKWYYLRADQVEYAQPDLFIEPSAPEPKQEALL